VRLLALATASFLALGLGSCGRSEQKEKLTVSPPQSYPGWAEKQGFAGNKQAERGARIFAQVGCLNCHTYLGDGTSNVGAPDLTTIGRDNPRSAEQFAIYVSDPAKFGNNVMPTFKGLGRRNLLAVGAFLHVSKGER
jgi:mono/diheme cytochrome c family protein